MHFSNRANNTLHLFKAGFEEYKQWFMGKLASASPFHLSLGHSRHPQSPRGGVEVVLQHGCWKGEERKGHLKSARKYQRPVSRLGHNALEVTARGCTCVDCL